MADTKFCIFILSVCFIFSTLALLPPLTKDDTKEAISSINDLRNEIKLEKLDIAYTYENIKVRI